MCNIVEQTDSYRAGYEPINVTVGALLLTGHVSGTQAVIHSHRVCTRVAASAAWHVGMWPALPASRVRLLAVICYFSSLTLITTLLLFSLRA